MARGRGAWICPEKPKTGPVTTSATLANNAHSSTLVKMATLPTRPEKPEPVNEETRQTLLDRETIYEQEKTAAEPWRDARAEIVRRPKPSSPR